MFYLRAIVKLLGGWRASIFAVLAVAALIAFLAMRGNAAADRLRADAAESRAQKAEGELQTVRQAQVRDALSETVTQIAIGRMDDAAAETNERLSNLERRLNGRPPVPAVCPDPDPVLLQELRAGADRFRATGSQLRGLRTAKGAGAARP